ncbi:IS1634 family transposase [Dactylosporangium sp. NPDC050588]|uniref:IS1634 family transposase n=1 Tax=Dactylosporangium sp. NPDC050588 TaxID=3157211 RepID=UPI0033C0F103
MYVRTSTRKTSDGRAVRYLQLAHNEWDPAEQRSRTKVLYSFGRADDLDRAGIGRLVDALSRLLDPAAPTPAGASGGLELTEARPHGGVHVLDALWRRLGIDTAMQARLTGRRLGDRVERILFALVANRALAPSSKLAATAWITHDVHIDGLPEIGDDACYRAMDWLLQAEPALAEEVFHATAHLLNLEVDLLFFDTTSTYFQTEDADEPVARDAHGRVTDDTQPAGQAGTAGFRSFGKSKDHRDDLPQVIVGMAVTRDGIPVRCWSWPGNTADSALIRQVKTDIQAWRLARVVWVADRGFASAANRRFLQQGDGHYILGEKLRGGTPAADAALSRQGRYRTVRDNLQVKEVRLDTDLADDRFVICYNPAEAQRDADRRTRHIAALTELIDDTDRLPRTRRDELAGVISTKPHLKRYLRRTPGGLLRIDAAAIATETNLDGKYLLRTSDPTLSTEDIALGYKQLLEVERGWRTMKQVIDLRPVYHRKEDRIRAHVTLCWLALLLIRIAETTTGQTWPTIRDNLQRLHAVTYTGPAGTFRQTTTLTKTQRDLLTALGVEPPKKILDLATRA